MLKGAHRTVLLRIEHGHGIIHEETEVGGQCEVVAGVTVAVGKGVNCDSGKAERGVEEAEVEAGDRDLHLLQDVPKLDHDRTHKGGEELSREQLLLLPLPPQQGQFGI